MTRFALGLAFCCVVGLSVSAEDKKAVKLSGTWTKEAEGFSITFEFLKADKLKLTIDSSGNAIIVSADYKVEADGTVKVTVKSAEKKGDFPVVPKNGDTFSFKVKVSKDKATLSDFKSEDDHEGAKKVMEGDYLEKK